MNNSVVIQAANLSKVYKLYNKPVDRVKETLHPLRKQYHRDFYALKDVSFEVTRGETLGIIGRNGSGKSTLLKILAGVLSPSSGSASVHGKVSALLELGTGFNPELSGIDNIYFNGSILGYTRDEMDARMDSILSFADIGDFVHQPIKMYSSGMLVRIAFAAAINIDPDILIIDEALSVGDAKFQRKCYAKFQEFKKAGKTVLFVSHGIETIKQFCDRTILLDAGTFVAQGLPDAIAKIYLKRLFGENVNPPTLNATSTIMKISKNFPVSTGEERGSVRSLISTKKSDITEETPNDKEMRITNGKVELFDFGILDDAGHIVTCLETEKEYTIYSKALFHTDLNCNDLFMGIGIHNIKGLLLYWTNTDLHNINISSHKAGTVVEGRFHFINRLAPGDFFLGFVIRNLTEIFDKRSDVLHFKVFPERTIGEGSKFNLNPRIEIITYDDITKMQS
jgi:ABC-type polysaccharide/polyol phosphate transport system ATPase subunit